MQAQKDVPPKRHVRGIAKRNCLPSKLQDHTAERTAVKLATSEAIRPEVSGLTKKLLSCLA